MTVRIAWVFSSAGVMPVTASSRVPGLDEPVGEVAGRGDEERAGAAGDVGDLELQDPVGVHRHPAVCLLVRARVVDEGFEGVLDDFGGEGLGRVVRAGGRAGRRLDHDQAAGQEDRGPVAQVAADRADERAEPVPQLRVGRRHRAQCAVGVLDLGAVPDRLGERGLGRRRRRRAGRSSTQVRIAFASASAVRRDAANSSRRDERDLRLLALLPDEADDDLVDVRAGVAEQALVDVADLLDVDVAEGDPPRGLAAQLGHLDGAEDLQHDPVADRDGQGVVRVAGGEEGEACRVEQRPAVGRQPDVLERRAPVQRLGRGEQPVPGQVGSVEGFGALVAGTLVERVELVADAVPAGEQLALREQAAFLGEQQEDHPHHHGDGGLVDLVAVGGQRVRLAAAPRAERRFGQRLHEQFDRAADVGAECLGDLLGGGDRVPEQLGEQVFLPAADQAREGAAAGGTRRGRRAVRSTAGSR